MRPAQQLDRDLVPFTSARDPDELAICTLQSILPLCVVS